MPSAVPATDFPPTRSALSACGTDMAFRSSVTSPMFGSYTADPDTPAAVLYFTVSDG